MTFLQAMEFVNRKSRRWRSKSQWVFLRFFPGFLGERFWGYPDRMACYLLERNRICCVFGVSAESMQCSYDSKGNSVPTILLLMQDRIYSEENSEEEHLRDQLNRGIVPDDIDVRCLAGLIKAWFHELPSGVLDGLSPNKFFSATLTESAELVKQQNPTESALLNCAINLMADVVVKEEYNKMDARNIAMVFAPNMMQVPWFMVASIYGCGSEISTKQ